jgi:iron complex transport system substrate-binding protein
MTTRRGALAALAASLTAGPAMASAPRRVVSLVSCLDAVVVEVAERGQIAALSHYAREPNGSTIAKIARTLPFTYESAEEVIALRPDLVLASRYNPPAMLRALQRFGVRLEIFGVPSTIRESLDDVRRVAALCGHPERGEAMIRRIDAALTAAAPPPGAKRLRALVFQPNGFTTGPGTLLDEMMRHCGFDNIVDRYGMRRSGTLPLELILADPPQVLLAAEAAPGAPTWTERSMNHPALAALAKRMYRATLPERLVYCGGPVLIQTAAALAKARREASA